MTSTFHFIGVDTGSSFATRVFPKWMELIGSPEISLVGHDIAPASDRSRYRDLVQTLKADPRALGALVTTHKIHLLQAGRDLFEHLGQDAELLGEVSCLVIEDGALSGYATDVDAAGASLDAIVGPGYFGRHRGEVVLLGAGGAGTAIAVHLLRDRPTDDRPSKLTVVDRSADRIDLIEKLIRDYDTETQLNLVTTSDAVIVSGLVTKANPHALVINATGMGKDTPGSPLSDDATFPKNGVVWELNYRGERLFLEQAREQAASRHLTIADGWDYFIRGWSRVIEKVVGTEIGADETAEMGQVAMRMHKN